MSIIKLAVLQNQCIHFILKYQNFFLNSEHLEISSLSFQVVLSSFFYLKTNYVRSVRVVFLKVDYILVIILHHTYPSKN